VVRAAVSWLSERPRLKEAEAVAKMREDEARQQESDAQRTADKGKETAAKAAVELYVKIREQLKKPASLVRKSTGEWMKLRNKRTTSQSCIETPLSMLGTRIVQSDLKHLKWERDHAFEGRIVPPRPNESELQQKATPLGPLIKEHGVVVQGGPFGSVWLRVGCLPKTPWHTMWQYLRVYVTTVLDDQSKKERPSAVYIAVSLRSMQAIDFTWLASKGFKFHHYRAPGHGDTDSERDSAISTNDPGIEDQYKAELVYYCWPGSTPDMVPVYSTSIEGVTGLILSRDETKLLMVWERKSWNTPGGAVNAGESKIDALERELFEEVELCVDRTWDGMRFLGGYHQQRARDGLINDNFSAFVVRAASDYVKPDGIEIKEAYWFPWRNILKAWRDAGRPTHEKRIKIDNFSEVVSQQLAPDRNLVGLNVLRWLDTYALDKGLRVDLKMEKQGPRKITKANFSAAI